MSLFDELKRRNVFRVGAAYLALGWIVTQVTATVAPMMHLPEWLAPVVVWIGAIAFPFVLLFSWVYELTPEGLKRESEIDRQRSITHHTARRLDGIVIALLVVAIGLFLFDRFSPVGGRSSVGGGLAPDKTLDAGTEASRAQGALPQQETTTPAAPDTTSIAVLPFADMSREHDQEYFSDGLSEELLNLLAQVPGLRVIARTSSFAFKGQNANIASIAQTLNVANVLEGSVRKSGNTLRITAQLVRAADSSHLWSSTYDREMTDIFKVQDEIAAAVVEALKLKLLPAQAHSSGKPPSGNTEAYNKFLLGRQYNNREKPEAWNAAVLAFQQAIELDPLYAAAYAGMAIARSYAADYAAAEEVQASQQKALTAADRAVELDPQLADGFAARAFLRANLQWDWAGAEADLQRALALDAANVEVRRLYAAVLSVQGRLPEAIAQAKQATELDPLSSQSWQRMGSALVASGELDAARPMLEHALAINPDSDFSTAWLSLIDLLQDRPQAALERSRTASRFWQHFLGAMAEHTLGHAEASQQALDTVIAEFGGGSAYQIALVYAWRGEKDKAFEWLERARRQHDGGLSLLKIDPIARRVLRDDPRYAELLKKIGLTP